MKIKLLSLLLVLILAACATAQPTASPQNNQQPAEKTKVAGIAQPTLAAPSPTLPKPTSTKAPTNTPAPTKTPLPTSTPTTAPTETPVPQPVEFSGTGDQVIDFDNPFGASFIHFTHQGSSNVFVHNIDANNEEIDLLVNAIGDYDGYRPIDWEDDAHTMRFQVEAEGQWTLTAYPIAKEYMRTCVIPGLCEGTFDDFVVLTGGVPDTITYKIEGDSNFLTYAYTRSKGIRLLINDIAPSAGTTIMAKDTVLLDIQSDGKWTFVITTK